jgi:hypothetical protein
MHLLQSHRKNVSFWALFLTGLLVSLLAPRGWTVADAFSILTILPHSDGEWIVEPPHFYWSMSMFRKRRTTNGKQATEAGRDCLEVKAS